MNELSDQPAAEAIAAVAAVADAYLRGVYEGDTTALAALFAPDAQVYGNINGQPYFKTIAAYLQGVAGRASPQSLGEPFRMRVLSADVMGNIGNVRLHSPMLGFNYHLYLTLRRGESGWRIVNKTFAHVP
ncbi:hypothetical protein ASC94_22205 [Massilia sp. Root418]|jgi:ketosteroid isomerase-like protein|uniref:nuclear transport factor 2 family protein n=1 Tax=Massilia sp. Root418 TaxID=1736532 RepID=UPI0006F7B309|nr:nuclear transport factor 2 family protein [Massilia sp. Root418]KQW89167.1 hypothetical protein ASC94_22205 [Massilia sp. Root418]